MRYMGTDRCPIGVEAVGPKWNWPEFEIRVQSRLIVSRPYSSPRPIMGIVYDTRRPIVTLLGPWIGRIGHLPIYTGTRGIYKKIIIMRITAWRPRPSSRYISGIAHPMAHPDRDAGATQ